MFGDQAPIFLAPRPAPLPPRPPLPSAPGQPSVPVSPRSLARQAELATKAEQMIPWVRGFKMCENQSPVPQDRVFFSFNYFNNLNYAVNSQFRSPVSDIQVYQYRLGLEKMILNGRASIGIRDGLNTLSSKSPIPGFGGTSTAMGDLNVFAKYILYQNWDLASVSATPGHIPQADRLGPDGGLFSGGMTITMPTGPGSFAGAPFSRSIRNTDLQPFLGYFWRKGRFYFQGFEAINVPLDERVVTMLYNDTGIGYYYYESPTPDSFLTAAAASFEVHANIPLNHRGASDISDLQGTADTVDLTYGTNLFMGSRSLLSLAIVTPVTGPRPFDFEVVALFNVYFGGSRGTRRFAPPVIGG